ncbi:MAG: UDP-2,3-diacylglucosamine diphosphatase LpxI [bacterium]
MIAIIAGTGSLPVEACKALLQEGKKFFVIALFPEDNGAMLAAIIHGKASLIQQPFYKPGTIIDILKKHKTTHVLMIGKVDKSNLLKKVKLDWYGIKLLASLVTKSDSSIMEKIVSELEKEHMTVIKQDEVLKTLIVPPGILTGTMTPELEKNIAFGIGMAQKLSEYDIGQTVVVKDDMILAVEAIEGTDNCIKRGIGLGKNNVIVCKAARTNQNKKFDLPTLGPSSLQNIQKGEIAAIAWLWSHTLIAQQDLFVKQAKDLGITLVSYEPSKIKI